MRLTQLSARTQVSQAMLAKQSSHFRWPASVPGLQEVAFLRAAGGAGPWLCLGLFPPDQQALWAPRSLPPQSLVPRPSSVKGPHPPPARPASALSRFSGTCARMAEYRARGEEEGSLSPSPREPGSGLLGAACQCCARHFTSAHGLSSPVNSSAAATSTLLPSWGAPGQHGCPVCAPRAPAALLQLPHPPGGAECTCAHQNWPSSLSHSRPRAAQSLSVAPTVPSPGPVPLAIP